MYYKKKKRYFVSEKDFKATFALRPILWNIGVFFFFKIKLNAVGKEHLVDIVERSKRGWELFLGSKL